MNAIDRATIHKLSWWHWPLIVFVLPLMAIGWLWSRVSCALGSHVWFWRDDLRIPCYGWGAWECLLCQRVKVKP